MTTPPLSLPLPIAGILSKISDIGVYSGPIADSLFVDLWLTILAYFFHGENRYDIAVGPTVTNFDDGEWEIFGVNFFPEGENSRRNAQSERLDPDHLVLAVCVRRYIMPGTCELQDLQGMAVEELVRCIDRSVSKSHNTIFPYVYGIATVGEGWTMVRVEKQGGGAQPDIVVPWTDSVSLSFQTLCTKVQNIHVMTGAPSPQRQPAAMAANSSSHNRDSSKKRILKFITGFIPQKFQHPSGSGSRTNLTVKNKLN